VASDSKSKKKNIFKKILGSVAPLVGTAIGGPFGGLATTVLREAFGSDDEADIERQIASSSPDALIKFKTAEQAMEVKMRELDIDEADLYLKDVQSARVMATKTSIIPQLVLTFLALGAFGTVLYVLVLQSQIIPAENKDLVIFLVGQLSTFTGMGFSFFLGSSKGSSDKNRSLSDMQAANRQQ
jgi:hypothetical protein